MPRSPSRRPGGRAVAGRALDVPLLAFELIALMESVNLQSVLSDDSSAYAKAGTATLTRLRTAASAQAPSLPGRFGD